VGEIMVRLRRAAVNPSDAPFGSRDGRILASKYAGNKIGYGPLNKGGFVSSECGVIKDPSAAGHTYVVAWQNLQADAQGNFIPSLYDYTEMTTIILDTAKKYEA
jgi:hypothetical protein